MVSQKPNLCKNFERNSHWRKLSMIMAWKHYCNAATQVFITTCPFGQVSTFKVGRNFKQFLVYMQGATQVFITTCPFGQVKYTFNDKYLPEWHFYLPQKKKSCCLYWKSYVHNTLPACPIRATVISWSFKMLARIRLLLAPGNRASAYVAPWYMITPTNESFLHYIHVICPTIQNDFEHLQGSVLFISLVGFTHIAVNFKFHSWFANFKLTSSLECVWTTRGFVTWS